MTSATRDDAVLREGILEGAQSLVDASRSALAWLRELEELAFRVTDRGPGILRQVLQQRQLDAVTRRGVRTAVVASTVLSQLAIEPPTRIAKTPM